MRNVFVTGAGSGIGAATCTELARRGWRVFGTFRTPPIAGPGTVEPVIMDLNDRASIAEGIVFLMNRLAGEPLAGMVNNAGIAEPGPAAEQPLDAFIAHLQVNVVAVHQLIQGLLPALERSPGGRIINVSSVSGRVGLPFTTAYSASKFALEGYSEALRRELMVTGVDVAVVAPGMVRTPIWAKSDGAVARYAGGRWAQPLARLVGEMQRRAQRADRPERIAQAIVASLEERRPPARRTVVAGRLMNELLPRALPSRWVDRMVARQIGLLNDP